MKERTVIDDLKYVVQCVGATRRAVCRAQLKVPGRDPVYADLTEVWKVLGQVGCEVGRVQRELREKHGYSRSLRLAEEFALKAQVAKAGGAAPTHRQLCGDGTSRK